MSYYFNAVPRLFIFTLKLGLLGNPLLKINAPHEKLLEELSAIAWLYMWFNYNRAYLDVIWQKNILVRTTAATPLHPQVN